MKCPICTERLLPGTDRCPACGYRVRSSAAAPVPETPRPVRRHRGCLLLLIWPLIAAGISIVFSLTANVIDKTLPDGPWISTYEAEPAPEPFDPTTGSRPAAADEGCFSIEDGRVYFFPDRWDGSPILTIPDTVDGQTVTAIGPGCFLDCDFLTTILLPEAVTEICDEAFAGCTQLRGLYLPFGMETIGTDAFSGCRSLQAICIPAAVTAIAPGCFDDCADLLYIIYEGNFLEWEELYDDFINPFTTAICLDGSYYHGTGR